MADKLAAECTKVTVDKDWEAESIIRLKFLPRTCEIRKPEEVEEWVRSNFLHYQEQMAAATTSSKRCTRSNPSMEIDNSSSDSADQSAESEDEFEVTKISANRPCSSKSKQANTSTVSSKSNKRNKRKLNTVTSESSSSDSEGLQLQPKTTKKKPDEIPSTSTADVNRNDLMLQLVTDRIRKFEDMVDQVVKNSRKQEKRLKDLEMSIGRLTENSVASADDSALHISGRFPGDKQRPSTSTTEHSDHDETYNTRYSSYPVGSVPWIKQTYGSKSHQLMVKLSNLGIGECKWPMIFDARYSAEKLLPQRILEARFTEPELSKFVMVRPNATKPKDAHGQPLKGPDGAVLAPTKTVLPGQKEMIGMYCLSQ